MTISKKYRIVPVLMMMAMLIPASLWAGGQKEEKQSQDTEQTTQDQDSSEKERVAIDLGDAGENAAMVNGVAISRERYEKQLMTIQQQYMMQGVEIPQEKMAQLKTEILESLIDQELLAQAASDAGLEADQAIVDQQLQRIKGQFPSEEQYIQALAQQGVSEDSLLSDIRKSVIVQQYISDEFSSSITVDEDDAKSYYDENPGYFEQPEQIRASHILFKVEKEADDTAIAAAKEKAEAALKRYNDGEEFSDLARELSEGPSASQGGDLGFFGKNQMVKAFEDAAFALEVGETAGPVRTDFGFHLIRLTAKNEAGTMPYEDVKGQISDHLYKLKLGEAVKARLDEMKEEAEISRYIEA